ncbi:MAG: YdcF family protein [Candidatus Sungbacteria bacterium]|uniref:YdcF family protein n=1 Tax=Candidatus Sungiibacteriota bacterium TaxID=2750080 RepID=A0A933DS02_9BACT|nr:YdcF family protein [Candidatus Sungbacteria bacterium]
MNRLAEKKLPLGATVLAHDAEADRRMVIVVTGDVPFEPGGKTLCTLMRDYLTQQGFKGEVIMAQGGTGTFREPAIVIAELKARFPKLQRLTVVSSSWHLWVARQFWREQCTAKGISVKFFAPWGTSGLRTRLFYAAYALFIRAVKILGLWPVAERILERTIYARRQEGFRLNGCA